MTPAVTQRHRELACEALHGYVPSDGSWLRGLCLTGQDGNATSWQWQQLNAVAQAIADAENRGWQRAAEEVLTFANNVLVRALEGKKP